MHLFKIIFLRFLFCLKHAERLTNIQINSLNKKCAIGLMDKSKNVKAIAYKTLKNSFKKNHSPKETIYYMW